jgi:uncharacterized circularly permuted ATP-grasp superfamily protein
MCWWQPGGREDCNEWVHVVLIFRREPGCVKTRLPSCRRDLRPSSLSESAGVCLHNGAEARVASLGPGFEQKRTAAAIWVLDSVHERYALNGSDVGPQQVVFRKDGVVPRFAICHDFCAPSVFV